MSLHGLLSRIILFSVGPLIVLAAFLAVSSVVSDQSDRELEAEQLAKFSAALIDQHLDARIGALRMLAGSPLMEHPSRRTDFYREAQGYHRSFGSHVILADLEMNMLFNTRVPLGTQLPVLPRPKGHAAAPAALKTGQAAVGDIFFGPLAREPLVAIAQPVQREGKTLFLLLTIVETRLFQERLAEVALPAGWSLSLIDGNREVIARRAPPGLDAARDVEDSGRFVAKSALSPWSAVIEIPRDVYRKPIIRAVVVLALASLMAILASIIGGVIAGQRLGREVASLAAPPEPNAPVPEIAEIAAVRRLLAESAEERKHANEAMRMANERIRCFVDANIVGIVIAAPSGAVFETNDYYLHMIGYTREEFEQGKVNWRAITPPEWLPADEKAIRELRDRGVCTPYEKEYVRRDGTRVSVFLVDAMLPGPEEAIAAFAVDVSERKQAHERILRLTRLYAVRSKINEAIVRTHERGELYRQACRILVEEGNFRMAWIGAVDAQTSFIQSVAAYGHEEGYLREKPISIREGVAEGTGPTGKAMREGGYFICNDIANDPLMTPWREEALKRGYRASASFAFKRENRIIGSVNVYVGEAFFFKDEEVDLLRSLTDDISYAIEAMDTARQRGQAEESLHRLTEELEQRVKERTTQLEAANRELESFSYSVSHDLRAPLRSIDGFSQALLEDYHAKMDDAGRDFLKRIREATQRMGCLIEDMLKLSRVTRTELQRDTLDLSQMVTMIMEEHQQRTPGKAVECSVQESVFVRADRYLLRIVVENLISNALKFTGREPKPRIEFGMTVRDGDRICFVRDNGVGFDMAYVDKLFSPFQRLHTSHEFPGTGIGLATVRRIIGRHGGRVWMEGEVGKGATAYFTLPDG